jgi:hypothetical protein
MSDMLKYNNGEPDDSDDLIEGLDYSEVKKSKPRMRVLSEIMNSIPAYLFMTP